MKPYYKTLLAIYLLCLLWIVLCKTSLDFSAVLDYQKRSLNLVPFASYSKSEVVSNILVFVPLGLLLGVNLKQTSFWRKFAYLSLLSIIVEMIQYALAIGATDITDIIANTLGGLLGLMLYGVGQKAVGAKYLDLFIFIAGTIVLTMLIVFRLFFLKVRY